MNVFYVYEHWRPDTNICFYVGKGHGNRAKVFSRRRSRHYFNVVNKLSRLGMCVEVKMVANGLSEEDAFTLERDRIAYWRGENVRLVNKTDGGEGSSGHKHTRKTRAKLSDLFKGHEVSVATRLKISLAHKGKKQPIAAIRKIAEALRGRSLSAETCAKLKAKRRLRIFTDEDRAAMSRGRLGMKFSEEHCASMAAARLGKPRGKPISEASRERYRVASLKREEAKRQKYGPDVRRNSTLII